MEFLDFLDADVLQAVALVYWLTLAFVLGAAMGSFVNVAAARLPLEKSLIWPGSRCGRCLQPVHWYDNLPLISYLWLRGRCRTCGTRFSSRYFWIELLTGLAFAGLFFCEVVLNVHGWPGRFVVVPPLMALVGCAYHAALLPWPVPVVPPASAAPFVRPGQPPAIAWQTNTDETTGIKQGIYAWPFWGPLPAGFAPGGNVQTGLVDGLAGALAGTLLMRGV